MLLIILKELTLERNTMDAFTASFDSLEKLSLSSSFTDLVLWNIDR